METSKVQVEFSDPHNIYPSIETSIQACFPLHNLHWSPPNRPLRSIDSLHIELIPDAQAAASKGGGKTASSEKNRISASSDTLSKAERRHQIPGLRQTPYLKIYFLHCDDIESYKANSRPQLRDWVNKNSANSQPSSTKTKQENHDAFEWLIIYLAREGSENAETFTKSKGDTDGSRKASKSRWTSRNFKSVIEKVRADFNGPSKHAVDHVAQFSVQSQHESQEDAKDMSNDKGMFDEIIAKMKSLILASFNQRVQQYEEDIKEKETQRNLPGWNFNTFFVLQEGLARGFENVGLLEDALALYQELTVGLDSILHELVIDSSYVEQSARFSPFTDDFQRILFQSLSELFHCRRESGQVHKKISDLGSWILDTDRKPFRLLILENNISVFDFECYLFARKVSLLSRLASDHSSRKERMDNSQRPRELANEEGNAASGTRPQNHIILTEICRLSLDFLRISTWTLRHDLGYSADQVRKEGSLSNANFEDADITNTIDNLVASWTLSVCSNVLEVTLTPVIQSLVESASKKLRRSSRVPTFNATGAPNAASKIEQTARFPRRTSSLSFRGAFSDFGDIQTSLSSQSPAGTDAPKSSLVATGADELAGVRGDLISLAKRTLSSAGQRLKGWSNTCTNVAPDTRSEQCFTDVNLDGSNDETSPTREKATKKWSPFPLVGVINETLSASLETEQSFVALYERMTTLALAHYTTANRSKMTEAAYSDLAVLYFRLEDYDVAASYFKQLTSSYNDKQWLTLGASMLDSWAQCLEHLGRIRESISVALRAIEASKDSSASSTSKSSLKRLIHLSESLSQPMTVPFDHYFSVQKRCKHIRHKEGWPGFLWDFSFSNAFKESFDVESLSVQIVEANDLHPEEIWLCSEPNITISKGTNTIALSSKMLIPGWFVQDKISLRAGKIEFLHEGKQKTETLALPDAKGTQSALLDNKSSGQRLLVWAGPESLSLSVRHSPKVDLTKHRSLMVEVQSGYNDVFDAHLVLRPASAGLRLHTSRAKVDDSGDDMVGNESSGVITLRHVEGNKRSTVTIPYELEHDLAKIHLRVEISYNKSDDCFVYVQRAIIELGLSIAVNVQESFKEHHLFSRFTIGPATSVPVRIIQSQITGSKDFEAFLHPTGVGQNYTFSNLSLSVIARINRRKTSNATDLRLNCDSRLWLVVNYESLNERITRAVERSLLEGLSSAGLAKLSRVLLWHFNDHKGKCLERNAVDKSAIIDKAQLTPYETLNWDDLGNVLNYEEGTRLLEMLKGWHRANRFVSLENEGDTNLLHELVVPVDLPEIHILHTVQLHILPDSRKASAIKSAIIQDQPVAATLTIRHTQRWIHGSDRQGQMHFRYQIDEDPHTWLVGGQRAGRFTTEEGERLSFSLIMVPLRSGYLPLPNVTIRPDQESNRSDVTEDEDASTKQNISSEVDYLSQGETILVDSKLLSTTLSLEPDRWQEGAARIEMQHRKEV